MKRAMAGGMRLGLAALVVALGACAGQAAPSPTSRSTPAPSAGAATVAIDDAGCTASGPLSLTAGPIRIEVANHGAALANFELLRFIVDGSFEALATHSEAEQARLEAGEDPLGPPDWAVEVTRAEVEPGEVGLLSATAKAETLAVVCAFVEPGVGVLAGPYLVGPVEVH